MERTPNTSLFRTLPVLSFQLYEVRRRGGSLIRRCAVSVAPVRPLWDDELPVSGVLRRSGIGGVLRIALAGKQLNTCGHYLKRPTLVPALVRPVSGLQRSGNGHDIALMAVLRQVLSALPPCDEVQKIGGILRHWPLDGHAVRANRRPLLGSSQLRVGG